MGKDDAFEQICKCIENHCPNLLENYPTSIPRLANDIMVNHEFARTAVGVKENTIEIENLRRSVTSAIKALDKLPASLRSRLNYTAPRLDDEKTFMIEEFISDKLEEYKSAGLIKKDDKIHFIIPNFFNKQKKTIKDFATDKSEHKNSDLLKENREITIRIEPPESFTDNLGIVKRRQKSLKSLLDGVENVLAVQKKLMNPAHKQKYKGAVVAEECRKIWQKESGKPAPVYLQHSRINHPLYRFVADVFAVLKIDKINPSSAFDSRRKLFKITEIN